MIIRISAAITALAIQSSTVAALTVTPGDIIRGAYTFPTFGALSVDPTSFLLRLAPVDLFGDGDAVGIRYLDATLTPLSFSRFDSMGTSVDGTVGIPFDIGDFLPAATTALVPSSGFVEIQGIAGSFDVTSLDLFAIEANAGAGILRSANVRDFEFIETPAPSPVPLPSSALLLLAAIAGLLGHGGLFRRRILHAPE